MTRFWCEYAWLGDPKKLPVAGVNVDVDGDRITAIAVGPGGGPAGSHRLYGLTVPGFANAHSHAFHRALRGRTHGGTGSFWSWRSQMYALAERLTPERYHALAQATFAEMALAGFTCVGEFHYLHEPGMGEAVVAAAAEAGVRLTLLDTCYLHGGIGQPVNDAQRRFSDGDVDGWINRVSSIDSTSLMRVGAAVHSVRAVDPSSIAEVARWAASMGAPLHAHVSEQPAENEECLVAYGRTPTGVLAEAGALSDQFTAVHATHLTTHDVALYAASGAAVCLCPTTERDLADGIGPSGALRSARIPMCMGTDSHAVIDAFEEMRAVELDERLASLSRGTHQPVELMALGSANGYRSLGWPDGGRIAVGALADFVTLNFASVRLAGAEPTSLAAVVFDAAAPDIHHVVVGGQVVVRGGVHCSINVRAALSAALGEVWA